MKTQDKMLTDDEMRMLRQLRAAPFGLGASNARAGNILDALVDYGLARDEVFVSSPGTSRRTNLYVPRTFVITGAGTLALYTAGWR
jgi:hypothetical protein